MEILVASSAIPYLKIQYPHMGPPTTPGPQAPPPSKSGAGLQPKTVRIGLQNASRRDDPNLRCIGGLAMLPLHVSVCL